MGDGWPEREVLFEKSCLFSHILWYMPINYHETNVMEKTSGGLEPTESIVHI